MPMHLAAYYEVANSAAVLTQLTAVTDQAIFTSGNDIRVPTGLAMLLGEAAMSAQTAPDSGQVQSPTLRDLAQQDVKPIATAVTWSDVGGIQWHGDNPRQLTAAESVNFAILATGGAAAANYGLIWLGDAAVKASSGAIFSVRATSTAGLTAGAWEASALTFSSTLPAGSYDVVGMHAVGANLVAARLVFIGAGFRPGVPGNPTADTNLWPGFRNGRAGTFGSFDVNQPPSIEALGATDTVQKYVFDLIKSK